jgi:WD40 repeat protein
MFCVVFGSSGLLTAQDKDKKPDDKSAKDKGKDKDKDKDKKPDPKKDPPKYKDEAKLTLKGHKASVFCAVYSNDGKKLASSGRDRTVKLWDPATGKETLELKLQKLGEAKWIAFSPDGKKLLSPGWAWDKKKNKGTGELRLWDTTSGKEVATLKGHSDFIEGVAFSSDGKYVASAGDDEIVIIWDVAKGKEVATLKGYKCPVNSVAFSADSKYLASASKGTWDEKKKEEVNLDVKVWDIEAKKEVHVLKGHKREVKCVAFSPDGKYLASGSLDGTVKIWDLTTGKEARTLKADEGVLALAYSSDGKRLATAGYDKVIKVWEPSSGKELVSLQGHEKPITSVAFSPDDQKLVSSSWDGTVKLWDVSGKKK